MRLAVTLTAVAVLSGGASAALASPGVIESTTRVSGASPFAAGCGGPGQPSIASEVEAHLAVDPGNAGRLLAAWQQDRHTVFGGARGNAGAVSRDGGRSFSRLVYPGLSTCGGGPRDRSSDPWVSFGADGTAYAAHLTFDYVEPFASADLSGPTQIAVQTSKDGGRSFGTPVTVVDEGMYDDREAMIADPWRPGRAYIVWTRRLGAFGETGTTEFSKTEDGGRRWAPHRTIHVPGPGRLTIPALVNVLPDGTLVVTALVIEARYAVSPEPVGFEIVAMRSTDGGDTWSRAVRIGETLSRQPQDPDGSGGLRALPLVSTAVAPDGTIYTVWNSVDSPHAGRIRFTRSTDGGRSWSAPADVAAPQGQPFIPAVAIGDDGVVGVLWDDTRNDRPGDSALTTDVWLAHSHDGGRTWDEAHVAGPFDSSKAAPTSSTAVGGRFLGDYQGLAAQPQGFVAAFPQSRPAAREGATDVFVARLRSAARRAGRLRISVRPRRVRAGRRTRLRFRVATGAGGPVRGSVVRFAGRSRRTGRRGRTQMVVRLHRTGKRVARASKPGFRRGRATVRVLARRPPRRTRAPAADRRPAASSQAALSARSTRLDWPLSRAQRAQQ